MALESNITSPHRRSQVPTAFGTPTLEKKQPRAEEFGSLTTLVQRHRFLLTALVLLTFLCTVYLYFAVTLGNRDTCSGMSMAEKAACQLKLTKDAISNRKLKFL